MDINDIDRLEFDPDELKMLFTFYGSDIKSKISVSTINNVKPKGTDDVCPICLEELENGDIKAGQLTSLYFKENNHYTVFEINGEQTIEEVHQEILQKLNWQK